MKFVDLRENKTVNYLEQGDLIVTENNQKYYVIKNNPTNEYFLVDFQTNTLYQSDSNQNKSFSHPNHISNHIKKHFGEFEFFKNGNLQLSYKSNAL